MEFNIKQYIALLFVNILGASSQSKCDIRVWYLNIVTDDVFNGELTDSQDRLRNSIETFVLKSTSSPETAMVKCNILDIYNNMLKEQFNYIAPSVEVVGDTEQNDESDSNLNVVTSKTATETKITNGDDAIDNKARHRQEDDIFPTSDESNQTYVQNFKEWVLQTCYTGDKIQTNGKTNSTNGNSILHDQQMIDAYDDKAVDTADQESNSNLEERMQKKLGIPHQQDMKINDANDNFEIETDIDETEFDDIYLDNVLKTEYEHLDSLDYSPENAKQTTDSNDNLETYDSEKALDALELPPEMTTEYGHEIYEDTTIPKQDKFPINIKDTTDKTTLRMCHDSHCNLLDIFFTTDSNMQVNTFTDSHGYLDEMVTNSVEIINGREIEETSSIDIINDQEPCIKPENYENTKEQINTLKDVYSKDVKVSSVVEDIMEEQNKKVHALELTVTKLENKLLMDALKKQDYSSTITKLENHILRMENELLKMNKNYQNLRTEHEQMSNKQNKYLKLAQTDDRNKIPPEVALYSKKNSEIIAEHQAKIEELSRNLHRHIQTTEAMARRFEFLEERNNMLHRMIMNQTLAISSVIQTIQHMSERSIRLQEQNHNQHKLGQDSMEKLHKIESAASDVASGNIIGQLDNYIFDKQNTDADDEHTSVKRQHFDRIHSQKRSPEPWVKWCIKASPLQCFYKSFVSPHCIPFSSIFWLQCSESKDHENNNDETPEAAGQPKAPDGNDSIIKHNKLPQSSEKVHDLKDSNSETVQTPGPNDIKNESSEINNPNNMQETTIPDKLIEHKNIEDEKPIGKDMDDNSDNHKGQTFHESGETAVESITTANKIKSDDTQAHNQDTKSTEKPKDDEEQAKQLQNENVENNNENGNNNDKSAGTVKEEKGEKKTNKPDTTNKSSDATNSGTIENSSDKPNGKIEAERETTNGQSEMKQTIKEVKDKPNEMKAAGEKDAAGQQPKVSPKYIDEPRYKEARDCYDHYLMGHKNDGIFQIKPLGQNNAFNVFCDMRKGGWTVIQRRQDGTTNFFLEWKDYKKGFGGLYGEHWLGNDNIHFLTNQNYYSLRVDLMDWDKTKKWAVYDYFLVEDETAGYRLNIDGYSGDAGDGLIKHHRSKFSTKDVDNDKIEIQFDGSCAKRFHGAGWYYKCYSSNLNGKYYKGGKIPDKQFNGVTWKPWTGPNYSLKKVEMKIRPASVEN